MNIKTTLVLLVCVVAGGVWLVSVPTLPSWTGLTPPSTEPVSDRTTAILTADFKPDNLRRIEVRQPGRQLVLERGPQGQWTLPGQWPVRHHEVEELVGLLTSLRSRFRPLPLHDPQDLTACGLDKPAVQIFLQTQQGREYRLTLAEAPGAGHRLTRPTFLRLAVLENKQWQDLSEALQLAPGLVLQLDRPIDYYQQRRLFPSERVAKTQGTSSPGSRGEKVERLAAQKLTAQAPSATFTLVRVADTWELKEPIRDRTDPDKVQSLLTAVPDLWAEHFVRDPKELAEYGLDQPERTLTVMHGDHEISLLIGKESPRKVERRVPSSTPPPFPGMPAQVEKVAETFRYAKLAGNDQIFEIKEEKLKDIFVGLDTLRDARLARFRTNDVQRIEVTYQDAHIVIVKKDDKFRLERPFESDAERSKVTELVDKLADLQARGEDILDQADAKAYDLDPPIGQIVLTIEEDDKDKQKKRRTIQFLLGKHEADKKKLFVRVDDLPRINAVEDALLKLVEQPALAYRGRGLFTLERDDLAVVEVQRGEEQYTLKKTDGKWRLTQPVEAEIDDDKTDDLIRRLTGLEAVEYVAEAAKEEDLDLLYGLAKPALHITLQFRDADRPARKLLLGKQRSKDGEVFAKLEDAPQVFVLRKDFRELVDRPSLALRPLQLWQLREEDIVSLRIQRGGEPEYRLQRDGASWSLSGPFEASLSAKQVEPLLGNLACVRAERYEAHAVKDLAAYGLDKPALRLVVRRKDKDKEAGREYTLLIGKPTLADAQARYAQLDGSGAVLVVGETVVSAADHGALDWLDRDLLRLESKRIQRIRSSVGDMTLSLERQNDRWQAETTTAKFVPDAEVVGNVLEAWSDLRAAKFADYGPKVDLAKYGLDKPHATMTVTMQPPDADAKPIEHTLAFGKSVEGTSGDRYARLDNGPGVVILPSKVAADLTRSYLDFVDRTVLTFDTATVVGIHRKMGELELELVKKDGAWHLIRPEARPADTPSLERLVEQLARLRGLRIAAYPVQDLKPFGLDDPAIILTLRLAGAEGQTTDRVLKIGDAADEVGKTNGDRFVLVEGSDKVAVLPGALMRQLAAKPISFRDRAIARFVDADRVILERGPRRAVFARVDGNWKLTEPVEARVDQDELEDFINALARLRADELVSDKPEDLKPYGLERPEARWRLLEGDKEVLHLLIGDREATKTSELGRVYARLAEGEVVFLLDPKLSNRALAEYRQRSLWEAMDAVQIERLDFTAGGGDPERKSFALEKAGETWQVVGKPEAKVSPAAVTDALAALANLRAERWVVDAAADLKLYGLDPPHLTIELRTRSGVRRQIILGSREGESQRRYARLPEPNRSDVFVISETDAARIVRHLMGFLHDSAK